MRILILISLMICLFSCEESPKHYHGIIVDQNLKPLSNVKIKLENNPIVFTSSNKDGFFKLKKDPDLLSNLIFSKKGYKIDTVKTVWIQSGEQEEYIFLNKEVDTIVLKKIN